MSNGIIKIEAADVNANVVRERLGGTACSQTAATAPLDNGGGLT